MSEPVVSFSFNLAIILRFLLAFLWGSGWATFLQWNRWGRFLVQERTWITVVIGVGGDLIISYREDWIVVTGVIAISAVGIIIRSLWNEGKGTNVRLPNKSQWSIDDANTLALEANELLSQMLNSGNVSQELISPISRTIANIHQVRGKLRDARLGEHHNA